MIDTDPRITKKVISFSIIATLSLSLQTRRWQSILYSIAIYHNSKLSWDDIEIDKWHRQTAEETIRSIGYVKPYEWEEIVPENIH